MSNGQLKKRLKIFDAIIKCEKTAQQLTLIVLEASGSKQYTDAEKLKAVCINEKVS